MAIVSGTAAQDSNTRTGLWLDAFVDRLAAAQSLTSAGQVTDALAIYRDVMASHAERHYEDALLQERRRDLPAAISALRRSVAADPRKVAAWLKLASLVAGSECEQACRAVLAVDPGNVKALLRLASLLVNDGKLFEAATLLQEAPPAAQSHYDVQLATAKAFWMLGDFTQAEASCRICMERNPGDARPYSYLLEVLQRLDRVAEAEQLCREFLARVPSNPAIRFVLAQTLFRQRRWAEAEATLLELLREDPGSLPLRQAYADLLEKSGRAHEALALLDKRVQEAPGEIDFYLQMADLLQRRGDKAAAAGICRRVQQIYATASNWGLHLLPEAADARFLFAQLEDIAGRYCTGRRALVDNTELDLTRPPHGHGEVVELFCMVMGRDYRKFLENVAFPALVSTQGFDELLRERKVSYNIYTTPADFQELQGFLEQLTRRGIRYRVNLELLTFSPNLYTMLCLPIIDQVKRSLALRSVVVTALPDVVYAGSIARVLHDMKPDESVVCAGPRINSTVAAAELSAYFRDSSQGLEARPFVRKCMTDFRHPQTYAALKSDSNCLRYRDEGQYYSARNWAPPPICFYARAEMLDHLIRQPLCGPNSVFSFYAIDHDFVDSAYRTGTLRLIDNSDYFFWAELTNPRGHTDFLAGRKNEDYYYPESARYIFEHGARWIYGD